MRIVLTIAFLLFCFFSYAQQQHGIMALARVKKDTIIIRWAPKDPITWKLGNKTGYKLIREEITQYNGKVSAKSEILLNKIKPLPLEKWEQIVGKGDRYAAIAAQALYGEDFVVQSPDEDVMNIYNQVLEVENRFAFSLYSADMSLKVARAMGLSYTDTNFDLAKKYVYRIISLDTSNIEVSDGIAVVDPLNITPLPKPMNFRATFGDGMVELNWNIYYDQGIYIAYIIERSDNGGKNFYRSSTVPYTPTINEHNSSRRFTTFIDSLESNDAVYHYRIRGINSFGETGPPSEVLKGKGKSKLKKIAASIDTLYLKEDGSAGIEWIYPQSLKEKIEGYKICVSNNVKGPYNEISRLLSSDETEFLIKDPLQVGYYSVKVIGKNGEEVNSLPALFQLPDSLPPLPPAGLSGEIDSTGMVYINWKPNKETDLSGYRVFRSNSLHEEFVQLTSKPLLLSEFREQIRIDNLTENIYYAIVAVDKRDNLSGYSAPLILKKPDLIPPSAPAFKKYKSEDGKISLYWQNSSSEDVIKHVLQRVSKEDTVVMDFTEGEMSFTDLRIINGENYIYSLYSVDDAGLNSELSELKIQAHKSKIRLPISRIEGTADRDNKQIIIRWAYEDKEVNRYVVYRKEGDGQYRFFRNVKGSVFFLNDTMLSINNIYSYRIKAVFNNDDESKLSEPVDVKY